MATSVLIRSETRRAALAWMEEHRATWERRGYTLTIQRVMMRRWRGALPRPTWLVRMTPEGENLVPIEICSE